MSLTRKKVNLNEEGLKATLQFIDEGLNKYKLSKRIINKSLLCLEESFCRLMETSEKNSEAEIAIRKTLFNYTLEINTSGKEIEFYSSNFLLKDKTFENEEHLEAALRNVIIGESNKTITYTHHKGVNRVIIQVQKIERSILSLTLISMVIAAISGLLIKNFCSGDIQLFLCKNIFNPFTTMFLNALKTLIGPIVLFSIAASVSQFSNFSEFGKIGGKLIMWFVITTLIAVTFGLLSFKLIEPGELGSFKTTTEVSQNMNGQEAAKNISIAQTIIDTVPDNIVKPFYHANMLQIIFIAALIGIAIGMAGDDSSSIKSLVSGANAVLMKAMEIVVQLIPIACFTSLTDLIVKTNINTILHLFSFLLTFVIDTLFIFLFYIVIIYAFARVNPFVFFKKSATALIKAFSLSSSNAVIPDSMHACKVMGVSPKIYSLSAPLGATINMNGTGSYTVLAALFLAKLCGITFAGFDYVTMIFTALLLAVGCPAIPGANIVCLTVILFQLGIPSEALTVIVGLDSVTGMVRTLTNVAGDIVCSLIVAKHENLLDTQVYNS